MKIPWLGSQCIVCLKENELSKEHIIPDSLGGVLTCDFVCKSCNDNFGSSFEAKAKTDPAVRLAVAALKHEISKIHSRIEEGQQYSAESGPGRVRGVFRKGMIEARTSRIADGSLMVPIEHASGHIERILTRDGHDTEFVRRAITNLEQAPEEQKVDLSKSVSVINWPTSNAELDLSRGVPLSNSTVIKIAFEFLALMSGTAICADTRQFNEIRRVLTSADHESDAFEIERLLAPTYAPFHGLCFEGNDPYAKLQLRLFGKLAYRVHFRRLALDAPKIRYTHDLKSGAEYLHEI
jgi:hypothetical protein